MRTDDLIAALALHAGPAPRAVVARRLTPALGLGFALAAAASIVAMGAIPTAMWGGAAPWVKLVYAAALAAAAWAWLARLARPGAGDGMGRPALPVVCIAMLIAGATYLLMQPVAARADALAGHSALRCPWAILSLSLPSLAGAFWALRGLAPTRLRATGAVAGILAGAIGAAAYALSCTEESIAFVALWYTLGIALSGCLGALLGTRFLRW